MLPLTTALIIGLQATPVVEAQEPQSPVISETWTIEYDIAILPFIDDYRRCLNYGNRIAGGRADFEEQHRSDLPRCNKLREESIEASVGVLQRRGLGEQYPPEQVADTFYRLGQIHIERGRFIDDRFEQRMAILRRYENSRPQPSAPLDKPQENEPLNAAN